MEQWVKKFSFLLTALNFDDEESRYGKKADGDICKFFFHWKILYGWWAHNLFYIKMPFKKIFRDKPKNRAWKIWAYAIGRKLSVNVPNPRKKSIYLHKPLKLVLSIRNTHQNATGDNWFFSAMVLHMSKKLEEIKEKYHFSTCLIKIHLFLLYLWFYS